MLVALALGLGASGCEAERDGGEEGSRAEARPGPGDLVWEGKPRLVVPKRLPRDRILTGKVRNDSLRPVQLSARELRVVDEAGKRVAASVLFLQTYVHGLYPPTRRPKELPEAELRRTGRKAVIEPGKSAPLTVSWRQRADGHGPARLDFGTGTLAIPRS